MATALHLADSTRSTRSHKILTQKKKRPEGFDAPRNSLDFPPESYQGYHEIYENIPFSCIIKNPTRLSIPSGTPVKKLIDEEMSGQVNGGRPNAPSVIARLMGMDSLPSQTSTSSNERSTAVSRNIEQRREASSVHHSERLTAVSRNSEQRRGYGEVSSVHHKPFDLGPFSLQRDKNVETSEPTIPPRTEKPQRREHPQEEQLQQFKKEFEEWLSKKKWEMNKNDRLDRTPPGWREHPTFSKGNVHEEKMVANVSGQQRISHQKPSRFSGLDNRKQRSGLDNDITSTKYRSNPVKPASKNRMPWINIKGFRVEETAEKMDESLPAANIVVLKPNAEYIDDFRETWANSPEIVEKLGSIEHFLEEVKERLRLEVQGKPVHDFAVATQGSAEGTVYKGKRTDPKQIAQHIARQIRESISRDVESKLMKSKSVGTVKVEDWCTASGSFGSVSKEPKNTFLRRLKNSHKTAETSGYSRNTQISAERDSHLISTIEYPAVQKFNRKYITNQLNESSTASFRLEDQKEAPFLGHPSSLSRSYSAPLSATSYEKLITENQNSQTGAHIEMKHETEGNASVTTRKKQRDGFNFKNKVSNLRHNLTLKHKLFNKKSSLEDPSARQLDPEQIASTALSMDVGIAKDNLTEVPPSPVSISSSSPDEFFKRASPVSPLDVPFNKENSSPQSSEEMASSILDESQSHLMEDMASEVSSSHVRTYDEKVVETYTHEEAYIQEILLIVDLYQRDSSSGTSPLWDIASQTVPGWVFDEVEKTYHDLNQLEGCSTSEASASHKVLFDLLNEALPSVLKPTSIRTSLKWFRNIPSMNPQGKKLLDAIWNEILSLTQCFTEPYLIENLVAHDIGRNSWLVMAEEETGAIEDDIASMILEQLLDRFLLEICF